MINKKLSKKLIPSAEEIVIEIQLCPGSIDGMRLEEKIDAFAVVKDYCRDIMYIKVRAAAKITQQVQDTAAVIRDIYDNFRDALQGLGVTFYFNKKFCKKWKMRQIEQTYSLRLQECIGNGLRRNYYTADEDLKLEFMINPAAPLQSQAEDQVQKIA